MSRTLAPPAPTAERVRAGELSPPGGFARVLAVLAQCLIRSLAGVLPSALGARALALLALAATACDLPTEAPQWEQRWILPADRTTVGVEELLPDEVRLTADRSAFTVQVDPVVFQESLGSLCSGCAPLDGRFVPKPAFQSDFHESVDLPADVETAEVRSGRVVVVASNGFSFDPHRPPGGPPGTVTLALRNGGPGGALLDQVLVDGATTSFAPGALLTRVLEYSGPIGSTLAVTVTVDSPAGGQDPSDRVLVRLTDQIQVTVTPQQLEVASALITVSGRSFDLIDTDLDVEDLDEGLVERVQSGAFLLDIANPWSIGATFDLTVRGPTLDSPITKTVTVPEGATSAARVELTQEELRSFLGQPGITLSGRGTVTPGAGAVSVTPDQVLTIETRLDLVLLVG